MAEVSDAAKALAKKHGIDLDEVTGTGAGGNIKKDDVEAAIAAAAAREDDDEPAEDDEPTPPKKEAAPQDPNRRHGKPKAEDVAAEALNAAGKPAKIDDYGRPETSEQYGEPG